MSLLNKHIMEYDNFAAWQSFTSANTSKEIFLIHENT